MHHFPGQCDKFRTLKRLLLRLAAAGACGWMSASMANAQEAHSRFPLTSAQIVSVMQEGQLPTRGAEVKLGAPITASVVNPPLEIQSITPHGARVLRLRVACRERSECLPFFAVATYPEDLNPSTLAIKPEHPSASGGQLGPVSKPTAEWHAAPAVDKTTGPGEIPMLHSGSAATLDFDADRVHVRIEVICLQSGAAGDRIRVTTRDRKQVYTAEVVAPALLKGTF